MVFAINTTVHDQILTLVFSHFCISFCIVCFCAGFYFFSTTPRDQLGRMCLEMIPFVSSAAQNVNLVTCCTVEQVEEAVAVLHAHQAKEAAGVGKVE